MSHIYLIDDTTLSNIAKVTKEKLNNTSKITAIGLPDAITSIPSAYDDILCIYDGEDLTNIESKYNTTISLDSNCTQGNNSLKLLPIMPVGQAANVGAMAILNLPNSYDLSNYSHIMFDLYVSTKQDSSSFQINFCTSGQDGFNYAFGTDTAGWRRIIVEKSKIPGVVSGANWANINNLRFTYFNYAQTDAGLYYLIDNVVCFNK